MKADVKYRRRTQAERSAGTREKVIQAVIQCIAEEGLPNASAARIASGFLSLQAGRLDELPVVDAEGLLVGILDVQDLIQSGFSVFDDN